MKILKHFPLLYRTNLKYPERLKEPQLKLKQKTSKAKFNFWSLKKQVLLLQCKAPGIYDLFPRLTVALKF